MSLMNEKIDKEFSLRNIKIIQNTLYMKTSLDKNLRIFS